MSPEFSQEETSGLTAILLLRDPRYNSLDDNDPDRLTINVKLPSADGQTTVKATIVQTFPETIEKNTEAPLGSYTMRVKVQLLDDPEGKVQAGTLSSRVTQEASFQAVTTFTPAEF
ncbi:MAG TPA: hypothetical protein VLF60_01080 [Candidatus Saccharimonadales bacterium]|nr:hypothetical protein [Candidatus Saccharimonadales bacterium]